MPAREGAVLPMAVGLCMPECAQGAVPLGQVGSPSAEALLGSRCVPFCEWGSASPADLWGTSCV